LKTTFMSGRQLREAFGELSPIHVWHHDIGQEQIDRFAEPFTGLDGFGP